MPLKTIKICPRCGKKTCDGSVWEKISAIPTEGPNKDKEMIAIIPKENNVGCGLDCFGRGSAVKGMRIPQGPVGITATRFYPNWVGEVLKPNVTYKKIED